MKKLHCEASQNADERNINQLHTHNAIDDHFKLFAILHCSTNDICTVGFVVVTAAAAVISVVKKAVILTHKTDLHEFPFLGIFSINLERRKLQPLVRFLLIYIKWARFA